MVNQSKRKGKPTASKGTTRAGARPKARAKPALKKPQAASKVKAKTTKPSKPPKTSKASVKSTAKSSTKQVTKKMAPVKPLKSSLKKVKTEKKEKREKMETRRVIPSKSVATAISQPKESKFLATETIGLLQESTMPYKFEAYHPKSGEIYMNDSQLKHFREILEKWKKELMKEVDNTITEMKGASVLADPNDRATQEEAFNLELRTRDRERKLIRKIEEALQQIDDREYGYCESCGVEIGIRRLEARPTAALCIDCKTLDEIRERTTQ